MYKIGWKLALGAAILAWTAGCGQGATAANDRQTVQQHGKEITVIDNPESASYGNTGAKPLVRVNDVRASEWLSDDELIVSKENSTAKPVVFDGAQWLPQNLYTHSNSTGQEAALAPGPDNQGYALVNASRTLLFYKTFDFQSNTGTGFVMNLKTRKSVRITEKDELELTNGVWGDDGTILYFSLDGNIYTVNADGSGKKELLQTQTPMINNLSLTGDVVYYTNPKTQLIAYSLADKKRLVVATHVVRAAPSPDGSLLALVLRNKPGEMSLLVTDANGGNPKEISKGFQIFGVSWSPDGKRLAYADFAQSGTAKGIYVADVSSGQSSLLSVDVKIVADPPRWNPSGDRLMVTASSPGEDGGKPAFTTYLVAAN